MEGREGERVRMEGFPFHPKELEGEGEGVGRRGQGGLGRPVAGGVRRVASVVWAPDVSPRIEWPTCQ